jgi:hypothetical protein
MPRFSPHGFIRTVIPLLNVRTRGVILADLGTPALAVANYYVVSTNMVVGAYTLAHTTASDGLARNVTCTRAVVTGADTPGTVLVTGTDLDGTVITETLTPGADTVLVAGTKAFLTITSIVGSGWVINTGNDTIVFGFGNLIGLPLAVSAAKDVVETSLAAANVTVVATGDGTLALSTVDLSSGTYNGAKQALALYRPTAETVIGATTAATFVSAYCPGYAGTIEEFGFVVGAKLAGAGGTLSFDLKDASANVIATLTITVAAATQGAQVKTTTIVSAYADLTDTSTLSIVRKATGTAFTAGAGFFYVRLRQRTQRDR